MPPTCETIRRHGKPVGTLIVTLWLPLATRAAEITAAEIVREAGIRTGLAVHLGTTDGRLEIDLAGQGFRQVHGLAVNDATCARARHAIQTKGLYGGAAVEAVRSLKQLPYADNLVNLVVADLDALADRAPARAEIDRVLVPRGVAYVKQAGRWSRSVKPRPAEMDDWTHPHHGPDEAKTSHDRLVGVPAGVQWLTGPIFTVAERKSSTESVVSAGGRIFYMTQNELINFEAESKPRPNYLVARDAFNGLLLWERPSRGRHLGKSGAVNPWLVATDKHLYAVENGQLVAVDAASGKLLRTYRTDSFPDKFLLSDSVLVVESREGITAFAAESAERKWHQAATRPVSGTVAGGRHVCFFETIRDEGRFLVVLDLHSGKQQWRKRIQDGSVRLASKSFLDIAFVHSECLGLLSQEVLQVVSAKDGKELWSRKVGDNRYGLAYLAGDLLWLFDQNHFHGLDPLTGTEKKKVPSPGKMDTCQPFLATAHFIIDPRHPSAVDLRTGQKTPFVFARGGCGVGFVAANGLLYTVPNACACYRDALRGFVSLTSVQRAAPLTLPSPPPGGEGRVRGGDPAGAADRLEKGPAHADVGTKVATGPCDDEWPTYRHDPLRSARTTNAVPPKPREIWRAQVGGPVPGGSQNEWQLRVGAPITAPVIGSGKVFLAIPNAHRLVALDAETGKPGWQFTAGGRISTPPTLAGSLCLFGAHDGWVYCLRAADGQLVWRYRVAPLDQRIVAYGQLESVWPVAGGVLVQDGLAYAAAGRAPGADGGIHVHALEPHTGRVVWSRNVARENKGGLCDLLVSNGRSLYVAGYELDGKTGAVREEAGPTKVLRGGMAGLLEASWTRLPIGLRKSIQTWSYGEASGQLLAFSPERVWGYDTASAGRTVRKSPDDVLFATGDKGWKVKLPNPLQVEALVVTKDCLFIAGPRDREHRQTAGGFLRSVGLADGRTVDEVRLASPPVYDGLAAASGRLYVITEDGILACLGQ